MHQTMKLHKARQRLWLLSADKRGQGSHTLRGNNGSGADAIGLRGLAKELEQALPAALLGAVDLQHGEAQLLDNETHHATRCRNVQSMSRNASQEKADGCATEEDRMK
eukprot:scaffold267231_cov53-Prasinocladus_malaysianus.AAC.1